VAFDDHSSDSALRTDIVKKRNRAGGIVCYQLMNLALCDGTTPGGPGKRPVSRKSPWALTMARRPTNFEKDKNKKWSCVLALTLAREEADGERGKAPLLSLSLLLLSAPSSVCCVPARCPSDCPSSLFILAAFYPGGMINGFTEAPRYLPLHPSSDPTPRSFRRIRPCSTRAHRWVFCFSSRQIIAPPLTQHGDCTTLLHTFSVPSVYRINIAAPW